MIREIVLDTETTGIDPKNGDRIIEIGCVEMLNHCMTGRSFHCYLNPERKVSQGAFEVHGLADAFLADKPRFAEIATDLVAFWGDARLVIHNASFDVGFLDMEFARIGMPPVPPAHVLDTLALARRKHPGTTNSLDALMGRYGIDRGRRVKHGALLDAEMLSEVYVELLGGRQADLGLSQSTMATQLAVSGAAGDQPRRQVGAALERPAPLPARLTQADREAHAHFVAGLGKDSAPLWARYPE